MVPAIPLPTPIMPSRSIPQGVHADGTPADLPPLPPTRPNPTHPHPNRPSRWPARRPRRFPSAKPATDSGTNKAEFSLPKAATMFLAELVHARPSAAFSSCLPIKPLSIKLPFGQKLEVEIFGKIVAEARARLLQAQSARRRITPRRRGSRCP